MTIEEQLTRDEGLRLKPYTDSVGKLTVGVGRNLTDVGLSHDEAMMLLRNDIAHAANLLKKVFPWTESLDEARRGALINMSFNMGVAGLAGFHNFLAKLQAGDYPGAAAEMLDSKWAEQVGPRAQRLSRQIETGEWQ